MNKQIDISNKIKGESIVDELVELDSRLSKEQNAWSVSLKTYELNNISEYYIKELIRILLEKSNLQKLSGFFYSLLKELAVNGIKANYKYLFGKNIASTTPHEDCNDDEYAVFLKEFRNELSTHGEKNLKDLARLNDKYVTITFEYISEEEIRFSVVNNNTMSEREKQGFMGKVSSDNGSGLKEEGAFSNKYREGAGIGMNIVLAILEKIGCCKESLYVNAEKEKTEVGIKINPKNVKKPV
jgi:hypothetical protein